MAAEIKVNSVDDDGNEQQIGELAFRNFEATVEVTTFKVLRSLIVNGGILAALLVVCCTVYPFWYVWVAACIQALYVIGSFLLGVLTLFGTITVTFKAGKK